MAGPKAGPNVTTVNTSVLDSNSTQSTQNILEEHRREGEDRARQKQRQGRDEITIYRNKRSVASAAEPSAPKAPTTSSHERIKTAHTQLKKAFVEADGNGRKAEQNLEASATEQVEIIQNKIDELIEHGAPKTQVEKLEAKLDALLGALDEYRMAHAEAEGGVPDAQTVSTASASEETGSESQTMTPEEQDLWTDLDVQLKTVGVDRGDETNVEAVQKKFMLKLGAEVAKLQANEKELAGRFKDLQEKWKKAATPEEKANLEKSLNEIKTALTEISERKLSLQKLVTNVANISDVLLAHEVSKQLSYAAPEKPKAKSAKVKSASVSQTSSSTSDSATQKSGSQAGLSVQSAGGPSENASEGPLLETASASEGDSYLTPEAALARTAATDFTGTTMAIASQGQSQRGEARRLDKLIKRLIMAAQSGNMDAVVSGLLFLGKRQNILTTSMGAQTLIAMQQYEKQLGIISNQIGALKPSPDYSSKLAKLNADMSIYSSSRQMITQTFRDFLNAKEEVDQLAHSVIGKLGQLSGRLASFQ